MITMFGNAPVFAAWLAGDHKMNAQRADKRTLAGWRCVSFIRLLYWEANSPFRQGRSQNLAKAMDRAECILTPPPKHWSAREKRTASRPRLAALSMRHAAWNVISRLLLFVAAASRDGSRSGGSVKMHSLPCLTAHGQW